MSNNFFKKTLLRAPHCGMFLLDSYKMMIFVFSALSPIHRHETLVTLAYLNPKIHSAGSYVRMRIAANVFAEGVFETKAGR